MKMAKTTSGKLSVIDNASLSPHKFNSFVPSFDYFC